MGNLFTEEVGKVLTRLLGNYLTEALGKVLDIYNFPAEHFIKNVDDAVSQYQSEMTGFFTLGGMIANAGKGYFNGGTPPFGYKVVRAKDEAGNVKSKLRICQKEAEVVHLIFRLKVEREYGARRIALTLNEMGLLTRKGGSWSKGNILFILKNPVYKGEFIFNRYCSKTKKEKRESEWVKIKVEPIIHKETFNEVQEILKQSSPEITNPAVVSSPTFLSGILKCGLCHSSMTLETGKGGRYCYYNCRGYTREGTCRGQRIPVKIMDTEVLEHLTSKFFSVKRLHFLVRSWLEEVKKQKHHQKQDEAAIHSEIEEEKSKLENIYRAIEKGVVSKGNLDERIGQIRRNTHLLEERLTELTKLRTLALPSHLLSTPFLQDFQRRLKEAFYQDSAFAKKYLKLFLDKIQVKGETVRIVARKDILLRAVSLKSEDSFEKVPTAGEVWLPGVDDVDHSTTHQPLLFCLPHNAVSVTDAQNVSNAHLIVGISLYIIFPFLP